jgi:hypothetical protein
VPKGARPSAINSPPSRSAFRYGWAQPLATRRSGAPTSRRPRPGPGTERADRRGRLQPSPGGSLSAEDDLSGISPAALFVAENQFRPVTGDGTEMPFDVGARGAASQAARAVRCVRDGTHAGAGRGKETRLRGCRIEGGKHSPQRWSVACRTRRSAGAPCGGGWSGQPSRFIDRVLVRHRKAGGR